MFEGPVTGNIPEVLDNGEVADGTRVTAGQLTPYAQVTDLAVNTAASGNNAAAIQSLDDRVTAELQDLLRRRMTFYFLFASLFPTLTSSPPLVDSVEASKWPVGMHMSERTLVSGQP